jgi:hypothetical protein
MLQFKIDTDDLSKRREARRVRLLSWSCAQWGFANEAGIPVAFGATLSAPPVGATMYGLLSVSGGLHWLFC